MNFLQREIKKDGKGLYINYGSCRLRPSKPKETKFEEGELVSMMHEGSKYRSPVTMMVFNNIKTYELWQQKFR